MALIHGGDHEGFFREYGVLPLDFSANCNPLGVPEGVVRAITVAAKTADAYPDPLCRELCEAIGVAENVAPEKILCGNGAADIIFRLAQATKPKEVLITAPAFAEYEQAARAAGAEVKRHLLLEREGFLLTERIIDDIMPETQIVFICDPNNPTGRTVPAGLMKKIARRCMDMGVLLAVDECFNGFLDSPEEHSVKNLLDEFDNIIILKAFTKLYGMAGVRLGYAVSNSAALLEALREAGQPWPVSSLAQAAGVAALNEKKYIEGTRALIKRERERLKKGISEIGMEALGGEANYIFFKSGLPELAQRTRRMGVLIRDCSNYFGLGSGYYRVAVRAQAENERLLAALKTAGERDE